MSDAVSRNSLYNGEDVYSVEWLDLETAIVRHRSDPASRRVCCKLKVTISDKDRETWFSFEKDRKGCSSALHRAYLTIEVKHGRREAPATVRSRSSR